MECDGHRKRRFAGLAGLAFGSAVMAFPDALGVVADALKLDGVASPRSENGAFSKDDRGDRPRVVRVGVV